MTNIENKCPVYGCIVTYPHANTLKNLPPLEGKFVGFCNIIKKHAPGYYTKGTTVSERKTNGRAKCTLPCRLKFEHCLDKRPKSMPGLTQEDLDRIDKGEPAPNQEAPIPVKNWPVYPGHELQPIKRNNH